MRARRVVLDANVIISALLFGGEPRRVLERVIDGSVQGFISLQILDEIRDVLQRPKFKLSARQAQMFVRELHDVFTVVNATQCVKAIDADPDDNKILECAGAADADCIVSGDAHLLELVAWRGIRIVTPAIFTQATGQHGQPARMPRRRRARVLRCRKKRQ
jgi:uncharacterized protein